MNKSLRFLNLFLYRFLNFRLLESVHQYQEVKKWNTF